MAGGIVETDPERLAQFCERFQNGAKKLYEHGPTKGDMWFFELYHHLTDCANALRKSAPKTEATPVIDSSQATKADALS